MTLLCRNGSKLYEFMTFFEYHVHYFAVKLNVTTCDNIHKSKKKKKKKKILSIMHVYIFFKNQKKKIFCMRS